MVLFLPFQNGEKIIFTAETVALRNGTVVTKQALNLPHNPPTLPGNFQIGDRQTDLG